MLYKAIKNFLSSPRKRGSRISGSRIKCGMTALVVCFVFLGCNIVPDSKNPTLVRVGNEKVTEKDFIAALDAQTRQTYLQFKKERLDKIVAQKILEQEAKKRKLSLQDLLNNEVFSKATVTHEEVHVYYNQNKKQLGKKKASDAKKEIEKLLQNQKAQEQAKKLLSEVSKTTKVRYFLPGLIAAPPAVSKQ